VTLAFLTGALASGFTAAGLSALLIWVGTVITGSSDPWAWAPWVVALIALLFAAGTYVAEWVAHRRARALMRSHGEPWAFRED
jgi:hypothetical protein